ncbi:hypothetical protein BofuT4_uP051730.1 [Botrytis cinerea T4]|uniref:Uncharacterized protein n=1 Tax=Botryotinia fuckeliana (strain T4) TaxID=999810 RepID=G2XWF4_BOTF4|nr:hypothetical protein BofuT4_uP051730.1 [Botrytis cinerea T4]
MNLRFLRLACFPLRFITQRTQDLHIPMIKTNYHILGPEILTIDSPHLSRSHAR